MTGFEPANLVAPDHALYTRLSYIPLHSKHKPHARYLASEEEQSGTGESNPASDGPEPPGTPRALYPSKVFRYSALRSPRIPERLYHSVLFSYLRVL